MSCIAWNPDGTSITTRSEGEPIQVREVMDGRQLLSIADVGSSSSLTWSPDGRMFATAGNQSLKIWNAATGELIRTLDAEDGGYWSVVWSPDGHRVAATIWGDHEYVDVWDTVRWRRIHRLERCRSYGSVGHPGVAWSPRGERLAAGNAIGEITVWNAETGRELLRADGHTTAITTIAWSPDGRRLATGSEDCTVKIWDSGTGTELLTLRGHDNGIYSVAWSPDGRRLATGDHRGLVKVWEAPPDPLENDTPSPSQGGPPASEPAADRPLSQRSPGAGA
jgi:WD40 repeat protein